MASLVYVDLLKPHPRNGEYFDDPTPEEYEQIKRSVAEHGIRDPLKVLPDYTVVAGCVRLRVAKELGFAYVPVEIWDVSGEEAEYLLVADNEERRECVDPVKKARRAEFLRRYWGVREGPGRPKKSGKNYPISKTLDDVANAVGEERENLKKLLKLNDLVPPLQDLVSGGKLGQTAAYSLAFLPAEEQRQLLVALGEAGVCGLSVQEAQELRRQLDAERERAAEAERRAHELERQFKTTQEEIPDVEGLAAELAQARAENERLKARRPTVVEKVVEKTMLQRDPAADQEAARLRARVSDLTAELAQLSTPARNNEKLEAELERKRAELSWLNATLGRAMNSAALFTMAERLFGPLQKEQEAFFEQLREAEIGGVARLRLLRILGLLRLYETQIETALRTVTMQNAVYEEGGEESDEGYEGCGKG